MKISAIICEFNPFHNGHRYLIEQAKLRSGCDKLICIMSGSFTQRGDFCAIDKYKRASHAILGGADAVLELPAAFTAAPAEIFAQGAIKILATVPEVVTLAFGCEDNALPFMEIAEKILCESEEFKKILYENLSSGNSYVTSYGAAFKAVTGFGEAVSKPNNVLGLEYCKAILKSKAKIKVLPVKRIGGNFNESSLTGEYSSASAIRNNICNPLVKTAVPDFVINDLKDFSANQALFERLLLFKLNETSPETLKKIYGCSEGLENNLKKNEGLQFSELINKVTNKRYPSSRIRRILLANLLGIYAEDSKNYLNSPLYLKPLAVAKSCADEILSALAKSSYPVITKQKDLQVLDDRAKKCFYSDVKAYKTANLINGSSTPKFDYPIFV